MTWIADLDLCKIHPGSLDAGNWSVPFLAVGWLEHPKEFHRGVVSEAVVSKLRLLVDQVREAYLHELLFRGGKTCTLCASNDQPSPCHPWSQENIIVPGIGVVYAAPGGIVHYVEAHSYLPPSQFLEAALKCPDMSSREYRDALRKANRDQSIPLLSAEEWHTKLSAMKATRTAIRGKRSADGAQGR